MNTTKNNDLDLNGHGQCGKDPLGNSLESSYLGEGATGEVQLTPQLVEACFFFEVAVAAEIPLTPSGSLVLYNVSLETLQNLQSNLPSTIKADIILSLQANDIIWVAGVARSKYRSDGPVEQNPEYGSTWRQYMRTLASSVVYELSALKDIPPKPGQWYASTYSPLSAVYPIPECQYSTLLALSRGVEFSTRDQLAMAEDDPLIGQFKEIALEIREQAYEPVVLYRVKNTQYRKLVGYGFVPPIEAIDETI